jgi:alkylation response protein AidB-like acyl-CoA dehydrogenase
MEELKNFGFGEEEAMVRDLARRFLEENAPIETLRQLVASDAKLVYGAETPPAPYDEKLWHQIVELGWTGLGIPEVAGGSDMKMVAVAALVEEIGRAALPSPLVATLLATCVLRQASQDAALPQLRKVVEGASVSLAITNAEGSWAPGDCDVTAETAGKGTTLQGTASFVQDARKAAFFLVSARGTAGLGLYCVDANAAGVTIVPDHIVDLTRDQAQVRFDGVSLDAAAQVAAPGEGEAILEAALPALLTIVAADLAGAAEWQLQATAEYARVRTQFDHPLGFFQAVKHPVVNMMIEVDRARSLVYAAACAIDTGSARALSAARMAKSAASDAAAFCCGRSVQLHGGIGFTWECDLHIYFKRQKHNQFYLGDGIYQREKLAELLGA